jgi:hypothetical protein
MTSATDDGCEGGSGAPLTKQRTQMRMHKVAGGITDGDRDLVMENLNVAPRPRGGNKTPDNESWGHR